jgi:hypothetical protein
MDEGNCQRIPDTWLTDLLARASHGSNNDQTDFTPKRALRHTAQERTPVGYRAGTTERETVGSPAPGMWGWGRCRPGALRHLP